MLKPCRSCKQPVDLVAETCPHCGAPKPAASPAGLAVYVLMLAGVVGVAFYFATCGGTCI